MSRPVTTRRERGDAIVDFGGGMVELAGFAASILKRGCGVRCDPLRPGRGVGGGRRRQLAGGEKTLAAFTTGGGRCEPSTLDTRGREIRPACRGRNKWVIGDAASRWCGRTAPPCSPETRRRASTRSRLRGARRRSSPRTNATLEDGGPCSISPRFGHAIEAETGSRRGSRGDRLADGLPVSVEAVYRTTTRPRHRHLDAPAATAKSRPIGLRAHAA